MGTNTGLISGRVKKVPATNADPNRYNWLNLQNAEPDLGVPTSNGSFFTSDSNGNRSWSNTIVVSSNVATIKSLVVTETSNLGPVGNITIIGGSSGQVLTTDGVGNLSWSTVSGNGGGGGANITVDNFTGNGVQTTFTLSVVPANIDQTFVNYNGVTLLRDAYSLSGANIIFDNAPANGSQIEVSIFATANGISGSSISNGTSNVDIATANGNITFSVNGNANIMVISDTKIDLGNVGNLLITGGSNGQALVTDGNGNVTWGNVAGSPGGFNTYVQFNDAGSFGGSGKFLFNKITNTLSTGNIVTIGSNIGINFQTTPGNTVSFLAPLTANNASFYVPESAGALQQVLTITSNNSVQGLGWKTLPANYIDITMRDNSTLTVNPTIVLRKYPVRLRSGTIINVATV